MVFIKHEWGMDHFVKESERLSLGSPTMKDQSNQKEGAKSELGSGTLSNSATTGQVIAQFLREVKYSLSGD